MGASPWRAASFAAKYSSASAWAYGSAWFLPSSSALAAACDTGCALFTTSLIGLTVQVGQVLGGRVIPDTTWAGGNSGNLQFIQFTSPVPLVAGQAESIKICACNCGLQLLATAISTRRSTDASGFTFGCALDGAAFTDCSSGDPSSMIHYSNLAPGQHTFAVHATDSSSNTGPHVTFTWRVGLPQPPTTRALVAPLPTSAGGITRM